MNQTETSLDQLRKTIIAQKTASLPEVSGDPQLNDLRRRIAAYDQCVSQNVIAVLQGAQEIIVCPDREHIERIMDDLRQEVPDARKRTLDQFHNYLKRLDTMQDLATQVIRERE